MLCVNSANLSMNIEANSIKNNKKFPKYSKSHKNIICSVIYSKGYIYTMSSEWD